MFSQLTESRGRGRRSLEEDTSDGPEKIINPGPLKYVWINREVRETPLDFLGGIAVLSLGPVVLQGWDAKRRDG